jgi:hypothetical protein
MRAAGARCEQVGGGEEGDRFFGRSTGHLVGEAFAGEDDQVRLAGVLAQCRLLVEDVAEHVGVDDPAPLDRADEHVGVRAGGDDVDLDGSLAVPPRADLVRCAGQRLAGMAFDPCAAALLERGSHDVVRGRRRPRPRGRFPCGCEGCT